MRVAAFSLTPSVVVAMVLTVKFLLPVDPQGLGHDMDAQLQYPP